MDVQNSYQLITNSGTFRSLVYYLRQIYDKNEYVFPKNCKENNEKKSAKKIVPKKEN